MNITVSYKALEYYVNSEFSRSDIENNMSRAMVVIMMDLCRSWNLC